MKSTLLDIAIAVITLTIGFMWGTMYWEYRHKRAKKQTKKTSPRVFKPSTPEERRRRITALIDRQLEQSISVRISPDGNENDHKGNS